MYCNMYMWECIVSRPGTRYHALSIVLCTANKSVSSFVRSFDGRRFLYLPESKEALSPGPQGPTPTAEPKDSQIVYHTNINHKYEATDSGSLEAVATWHAANPGGLGTG